MHVAVFFSLKKWDCDCGIFLPPLLPPDALLAYEAMLDLDFSSSVFYTLIFMEAGETMLACLPM